MQGQLRAQGTIKELKKIDGHPIDVELRENSTSFVTALQSQGIMVMPPKRTTYRIQMPGVPEEVAKVVYQVARDTGAQIRGFVVAERSLEDAFLEAISDK